MGMVGTPKSYVRKGGQVSKGKGKGGEGGEAVVAAPGRRMGDGGRRLGGMEDSLEGSPGNETVETGARVSSAKRGGDDDSTIVDGRDVVEAVRCSARSEDRGGGELGKDCACWGPV